MNFSYLIDIEHVYSIILKHTINKLLIKYIHMFYILTAVSSTTSAPIPSPNLLLFCLCSEQADF